MMEAGHLQDEELVRGFKTSRSEVYFAALFDRYARKVYATAYRMLHDRSRAEDCVQETFRRAMEDIDSFDEGKVDSSLCGWLTTIAVRVCIDEFRRLRIRNAYVHQPQTQVASQPLSQEQRVLLSELREVLTQLEPNYRMSFLLFHVNGYSYKEIMRLIGVDYQQVKTYIQTAQRHVERHFNARQRIRTGTAR